MSHEDLRPAPLRDLALYFLRLGALGFGGPIALTHYMQRDLQEQKRWITAEDFQDGLAIAQTLPGPLATQLAMWIGLVRHGILGATIVGTALVLPPFLFVVAIATVYVSVAGMPVIRALFYGISPAVIAIIILSAWRLAKSTNARDPKLWTISAALLAITALTRSELAWLFIVAGLLGILIYAPPWHRIDGRPPDAASPDQRCLALMGLQLPTVALAAAGLGLLVTLGFFFLKASLFSFGSGLAIVPFLHQGVVVEQHWLTEPQFLDAISVGIITPGPVVITAAFIGYLVAGLSGAIVASIAIFVPVWALILIAARLFLPYRSHPQVRGFVKGVTAAAVGAIAGAGILLGRAALVDLTSVAVFGLALLLLYFVKLKEPYLICLAGVAGLLLYG